MDKLRQQKNLQLKKKLLEERAEKLKDGLPHLYGWNWYSWAKEFFESRNKMTLLCAANQISKSSTQIRKCIHWATNKKLWGELWKIEPKQFWYLYPDKKIATVEFENKWVPEFLPRNEFKDHEVYGWEAFYEQKKIDHIKFNSGVTIYFKTYSQDPHSLQASTVHAIFCDEELPEDLYDELMMRLEAVDGYYHMVFTATRNQQMWWRAIEARGEQELFVDALKLQVSMYDCQKYLDGSPGVYNVEKIKRAELRCKSNTEVLRRIHGKFVTEVGRKYGAFDPSRHFIKPFTIQPHKWHLYGGVDIGSGGARGHPAAVGIIAVSHDYSRGIVIRGSRMDGIETTSSDILAEFQKVRGSLPLVTQTYDQGSKDFYLVATRAGEPFIPAEKNHEMGEDRVNTLFKNDMLKIFDTPDLRKLGIELMTVMKDVPKKLCKDDFIDGAVRYPVMAIPWDWSKIKSIAPDMVPEPEERALTVQEYEEWEIEQRRGKTKARDGGAANSAEWQEHTTDIAFWNDQYG